MIKTFIALGALAVASAAPAETFTQNGVTYIYTVAEIGNATVISGNDSLYRPFQLRVVRNRVAGHFDGTEVSFDVPAPLRKLSEPALASR